MSKTAKQPAAKTTIRIGKGKTTTKPSRVLEVARQRKEIDAARAAAKPTRKAAAKATRDRGDASPKKPPRDPQPPTREGERIVLQKPFSLEVSQDITDRCQELTREREALAALKAQRTGLRKARAANDIDLQETVQEENDEGRGIKGKDKPYSLAASQRITTLEAENKRLSAKIKGLDETIADKSAAIREIPDRIKELALEGAQGQGRLFSQGATGSPTDGSSAGASRTGSTPKTTGSTPPTSDSSRSTPSDSKALAAEDGSIIFTPLMHHKGVKLDMAFGPGPKDKPGQNRAAIRISHDLSRHQSDVPDRGGGPFHESIDHAEHAVLVAARTWLTQEKRANNDDKTLVTELTSALGKVERLMEACENRIEEAKIGRTKPAPSAKAKAKAILNGTANGHKPEPEDKSGIPKGWHVLGWAEISGRGLVDPADAPEAGELPERWTSPRAALMHIQQAAENGNRPFAGQDRRAIENALNTIAKLQTSNPTENIQELLESIDETASDLLMEDIAKHSAQLYDLLNKAASPA